MKRVLIADLYKIIKEKWVYISLFGMLLLATAFIWMQKTAMSYTVMLDRVLFLPMSVVGLVLSVTISFLAGEDFDSGFMRNKIVAGIKRGSIYGSGMITSTLAAVLIYTIVCLYTFLVGMMLFEQNVTFSYILYTFAMGICMVCSYTSLYFFVVMQSGSKVKALVINMIIGCILLFLGMRDNQIMMQKDVADSLYRTIHEITFDINPAGQAAQVSAMKFLNPIRFVVSDFVMIVVVDLLGKMLFDRKQLS